MVLHIPFLAYVDEIYDTLFSAILCDLTKLISVFVKVLEIM